MTQAELNEKRLKEAEWSRGIVFKNRNDAVYISIPFTWNLPKAYSMCVFYKSLGYRVFAGGTAVALMPDYLKNVSDVYDAEKPSCLHWHNPNATRTSTGCINRCKFCAVKIIEGDLKELSTWEPKPIVCDNNLLACSRSHFNKAVDSLKNVNGIDFNQGLDCRLINEHHLSRFQELDIKYLRFSWDNISEEKHVKDAIKKCLDAGYPKIKIRIYVLVNFDDTPEEATYKITTLKSMGITSFPMRFQPLNTLKINSYVSDQWDKNELKRFIRYWSRWQLWNVIPYEEFRG